MCQDGKYMETLSTLHSIFLWTPLKIKFINFFKKLEKNLAHCLEPFPSSPHSPPDPDFVKKFCPVDKEWGGLDLDRAWGGSGRSSREGNGNPLQSWKSHGQRSLVGYGPWVAKRGTWPSMEQKAEVTHVGVSPAWVVSAGFVSPRWCQVRGQPFPTSSQGAWDLILWVWLLILFWHLLVTKRYVYVCLAAHCSKANRQAR